MANYRQYSAYRSRRPASGPRRTNRILLILLGLVVAFFAIRGLIAGPKNDSANTSNANGSNLSATLANLSLNSNGNRNGNVNASTNVNGSTSTTLTSCDRAVSQGATTEKQAALTFDGGAAVGSASSIVSTLKSENVPATFFVTGEWAKNNEALLKDISASFPVHNHSYDHPDFTTIPEAERVDEVTKAETTISSVTGKTTKPFFRPPYGALDKEGKIVKQLSGLGYCTIMWTVDALDWQAEATVDSATSRVLDRAKPGMIVLMHVGDEVAAGALPKIIAGLRDKGYSFVPLTTFVNP